MIQIIYNNRKAIIFLFIALIAFIQRGSTLFIEFYDVDEITDVLMTSEIMLGGEPYVDAVPGRPFYFLFFYISFCIVGIGNILGLHFMTILVIVATAYFLYRANKVLFNEKAGYFAALFYVIFVSGFLEHYLASHGETVMNLPSSISFYLFVLAAKVEKKYKSYLCYFLSGSLLLIAFLTKGHSGLIMIAYGVYLVIIKPIKTKEFYNNALSLLFIVFGFMGIVILVYFIKPQLVGMITGYVSGNIGYISVGINNIAILPFINKAILKLGQNMLFQLPLWLLTIYFLIRNRLSIKKDLRVLLLLAYLVVSFLGIFLGGDRLYNHYFIQYIPALCLIAGYSLVRLMELSFNHRIKVLVNILLVMSIMINVLWNYTNGFLSHFSPSKVWTQNHAIIPRAHYIGVSNWIQKNSTITDKILVWGDIVEIYYFSNRRPGIRFLWCSAYAKSYNSGLTRSINNANSAISSVITDLDKKKPRYFIDTAPSGVRSFGSYPLKGMPILYNYIKKHYQHVNTINKMDIYQRKSFF